MALHEREPPLLSDRGNNQHELHPRERLADALARTATEQEIRESRQRRFDLRGPAIGNELFGPVEVSRITVHHVLPHEQYSAGRDVVPAEVTRRDRPPAD